MSTHDTPPAAVTTDREQRFGGVERLYGRGALERLAAAHVCVVGLGGVGSWTVEALARSGIGALTLVDLDEVCVTNTNRQLSALRETIGRSKATVLEERVQAIHPTCRVRTRAEFFTESTADGLFADGPFDWVVDAIDSLKAKTLLIARARAAGVPIVVCGGAGGRRDPTQLRVVDLAFTHRDPLLRYVRKKLRSRHGFPRDEEQPFGVTAVYTQEIPLYPWSDGSVRERPEPGSEDEAGIGCAGGLGTAAFVTGAFGLTAASVVVNALTGRTGDAGRRVTVGRGSLG